MQVPRDGRRRVVIENVRPEIDGGRYPAKGSVGEPVMVEADVLANAGATLPRRDVIDERILRQYRAGSGKVIRSQDEVGGYEPHTR